jgi:hypothetical protein
MVLDQTNAAAVVPCTAVRQRTRAPRRQLSFGKGSGGARTRALATWVCLRPSRSYERLARPPVLTNGRMSMGQRHPCGAGRTGR